jgi:prevent-host-death family protein
MDKVSISVTEAARNFAECVNRARYQGTTFVLHKNGKPVARIVPEERKATKGRELAAALRTALKDARLGQEEADAWKRDLDEARENDAPPVGKWQS